MAHHPCDELSMFLNKTIGDRTKMKFKKLTK